MQSYVQFVIYCSESVNQQKYRISFIKLSSGTGPKNESSKVLK